MPSENDLDRLQQERLSWEANTVQQALRRHPEPETITTWSGIPVERLYGPVQSTRGHEGLGLPGQFPFTRGVQATGYRAKLWTRRPITGFRSAHDTNLRVRSLLESGQTGIHFVFDYPTLAGYDSDHALSEGEVGVSGIPIDSIEDMRLLLEGISLPDISISYSHWGPYILSFLLAYADEQSVPYDKLAGTTQNDVLMYAHSCPWWDLPLEANMKLFVDVVEFANNRMPMWNPVSISGYNIREGGCSAVQEIAFTLGDAIAYLDACAERGLPVEQVAPTFSFMLCAQIDFFEEVCKMRAIRRMWATLIRDRYGCEDLKSQKFRFHAQTSGASLTAQQPSNNVIRGTVEAMAAVLGGAQSLHVSCYDETYGLPTDDAIRVSLNTQNILSHETGLAATVDPLGGSYYVEALTDELEHRAWRLLEEVEALGGMVAVTRSGWVREQKHIWARQYQEQIEGGQRIVVGVNRFQIEEDREIPYLRPDPEAERAQINRVRSLRVRRDSRAAEDARTALMNAARNEENTVPYAIEAAKNLVTLGEMYQAMRECYGDVPEQEKTFM